MVARARAAQPPSLEPPTLLDGQAAGYRVCLYPQSGEASITRCAPRRADGDPRIDRSSPDRLRENAVRAGKRAKSHVRRYSRANRCRFLWTFTYGEASRTLAEAGADMDRLLRALRETFGRLPFVAVAEPHPGGHGYHWHAGTNRRLPHKVVARLWGHGWVWVGDPGKLPGRVSPRKLAAYLAKYVAKSVTADGPAAGVSGREHGQHRYRVSQGFTPAKISFPVELARDGYEWLHLRYGQHDLVCSFSFRENGPTDGWFLSFPDRCLCPPPTGDEPPQLRAA